MRQNKIPLKGNRRGRKAIQVQLRSARDAAEKANRAKDRFLAVLSHELRTPLSPALLIATSMARDAKLPVEARENLSLIARSIHIQSRLIDARGRVFCAPDQADRHRSVAASDQNRGKLADALINEQGDVR